MTIARVIPLRRFDVRHQWFDYEIPSHLDIRSGMLVTVPFLRRSVLGLVWDIGEPSTDRPLRPITDFVAEQPLFTDWQRRLLETISKEYAVSLGHLVNSMIPRWSKRTPPRGRENGQRTSETPKKTNHLWYADRQAGFSWIQHWIDQRSARPRLLLVPTKEDVDVIAEVLARFEPIILHGQLTPRQYRLAYEKILHDDHPFVVGTQRAFLAPFCANPDILIDQQEHSGHRQTMQHPRLDAEYLLRSIGHPFSWTSPAPAIRLWNIEHPTPPTRDATHAIARLDGPWRGPWVSDQVGELFDEIQSTTARVMCIVPRAGIAGAIRCDNCGTPVTCPTCSRIAAVLTVGNEGVWCRSCRKNVFIPTACPKCHQNHFVHRGLSTGSFRDTIQRLWPDLHPVVADESITDSSCLITTPKAYHWVDQVKNLTAIIWISGDSHLQFPDFASGERTWQLLARFQAAVPQAKIIVQTYDQGQTFWQRWQQSDHTAWYTKEIAARQSMQVPPTVDQWMVMASEPVSEKQSQEFARQLTTRVHGAITVETIPGQSKQRPRLVIGATKPGQKLDTILPRPESIPYPWQLDPSVVSWWD